MLDTPLTEWQLKKIFSPHVVGLFLFNLIILEFLTVPMMVKAITKVNSIQLDQKSNDEVFQFLNRSGTGYLGFEELRAATRDLGEDWTDDMIDEMIFEADVSGHGAVTASSFKELFPNPLDEHSIHGKKTYFDEKYGALLKKKLKQAS